MIKNVLKFFVRLSTLGLEKGIHMTRFYMYEHLKELMRSHATRFNKPLVLSVGSSLYLTRELDIPDAQIVEANYPEYNVLDLKLEDAKYDIVVMDQVLEHVGVEPWKAFDELHRVLKEDGIAIVTTVFGYEIHGAPGDFLRYTPDALRALAGNFSQVIEAEGWGNKTAFMCGRYFNVPYAKWHPLHKMATRNNPRFPIVTWVVCQK